MTGWTKDVKISQQTRNYFIIAVVRAKIELKHTKNVWISLLIRTLNKLLTYDVFKPIPPALDAALLKNFSRNAGVQLLILSNFLGEHSADLFKCKTTGCFWLVYVTLAVVTYTTYPQVRVHRYRRPRTILQGKILREWTVARYLTEWRLLLTASSTPFLPSCTYCNYELFYSGSLHNHLLFRQFVTLLSQGQCKVYIV